MVEESLELTENCARQPATVGKDVNKAHVAAHFGNLNIYRLGGRERFEVFDWDHGIIARRDDCRWNAQ